MILYRIFPFLIALVGVVAGVFRTFELDSGFTEQGLAVSGNVWRLTVLIISAVVFLITLFLSVNMNIPKKRKSPLLFINFAPFTIGTYYLAFIMFFFAAVVNLYWALKPLSVSWLIAGLLLFFAAVSFVPIGFLLRRGVFQNDLSFLALVPVFWACYHLILHFRQDTQNPVIAQYMISVFAMAFLVLQFHAEAGMLFSKKCAKRLFFSSVMSLFFNIVYAFELGKQLLSAVTEGFQQDDLSIVISGLIALGAICFSAFCLLSLLRKKIPTEYRTDEDDKQ